MTCPCTPDTTCLMYPLCRGHHAVDGTYKPPAKEEDDE